MEEKKEFTVTPIEEERVVEVTVEKMDATQFKVEEIMEDNEKKGVAGNSIKANHEAKKPVKEYVYGTIFALIAVGTLVFGLLVERYLVAGIICTLLGAMASYSMFNVVIESKKIMKLLDSGEVRTVEELMLKLKKKKKYDFLRNLGGMIRAGYVVGYEIIDGKEIKKVSK